MTFRSVYVEYLDAFRIVSERTGVSSNERSSLTYALEEDALGREVLIDGRWWPMNQTKWIAYCEQGYRNGSWVPGEVRFLRDDIDRLWPPEPATGAGAAVVPSGYPGRPSNSKHLISDEFERRIDSGRTSPSLAAEARELLKWLIDTHPTATRPTAGAIENDIRARYRSARPDTPQ